MNNRHHHQDTNINHPEILPLATINHLNPLSISCLQRVTTLNTTPLPNLIYEKEKSMINCNNNDKVATINSKKMKKDNKGKIDNTTNTILKYFSGN